jgi:uncharacterized membrane protein (UPF0182 family)
MPRRFPRISRRARIGLLIGLVVLIVLLLSLRGLAGFWTDYLWFDSVGYTSVFRGVLLTKLILALVFILLFFGLMWVNLYIADRVAPEDADPSQLNELVLRYREYVFPRGRIVQIATAAVFALLAGSGASREWNNWDLFRYHVSFGKTDPQYHKDVGFYVFQLPFIQFLLNWLFEAMIVVLIVTVVFYYLNGGIAPQSPQRRATAAAKTHISVLLGVLALIKAVDYYFERLQLVLSRSHVVNGATATSVHANKPALFLLMVIAVIAAGLFLYNIRQRGWVLPVVGVALWVLVSIVVGGIYPAVYQALRVKPSELTRETPYIKDNINATLAAYGLDNVNVDTSYTYSPTVASSQIQGSDKDAVANQQTLANVRLLDPNVNLLSTFNKYQGLRSYYGFNNLNLDRYTLAADGSQKLTATISSVRELGSVPSGFVNQHLTYTHGYGAIAAPVSQSGVLNDGTPAFSLSQIPPVGVPSLSQSGSEVYYGAGPATGGYVIAASKTQELNYENANGQQQYTKYTGKGGVEAGSIIRRLAFALRFGDANFVLSGQITPSSRVLYIRNVVARAHKAAPFLKFDSDPYAVITDNGQVYWVLDAYTTTDNYPYSQNAVTDGVVNSGLDSTFNYVRNSVKVVTSAYDGTMHFFDMGTGDPILRVYERAFPDLFIPVSQADSLIPGIREHFRFPEDLFTVLTNMYGRYHLTDPTAFYTQAQAWAVTPKPSNELSNATAITPTAGSATTAAPTSAPRLPAEYTLAHQPGETNQDFMLLTPFVPRSPTSASQTPTASSLNLTAFMTASSDPTTYGQLSVYTMPPGSTVAGPGLIANAIRSNPTISKELSLYNQQSGGSTAELGAVGIVPLDNTLLYVQPVYVESSSDPNNPVPLLRDVVVVYNGTAYDSGNASLDNALCQIQNSDGSKPFNQYCNTPAANSVLPSSSTGPSGSQGSGGSTTTTTTTTAPSSQSVQSLLQQANTLFAAGDAAAKQGDVATWASDYEKAKVLVQKALNLEKPKSGG